MQQRSQEEKILDAAYNIIAREGYVQTSLRQIAQEANVAVSQISYHYENKQGLLVAVVRRVANKYYAYMQAYIRPEMTPREKGECFIRLYQEVLEREPELFRVLYDLVGLALWSEPMHLQVREIFQGIIDLITQEVFTTEFVQELGYKYTPETLSSMFFGGIFGIAVQALLEPSNGAIADSLCALNTIF
ncbi:MAG: TetR/AcrR family transcriptional regulator [Firmicutes bacterium]|nr:TetR/AcrR family transcriptional regulator [Bacillota bacterium]